jgi:hypothetical protein
MVMIRLVYVISPERIRILFDVLITYLKKKTVGFVLAV